MGMSLRVPRPARLASWVFAALSLVAPFLPKALRDNPAELIGAVAPVQSLAPGQVEAVARVAAWLAEAEAAAERDQILEAIRKDPKGFSLFAGSTDLAKRREVLADTPFASQIAEAATEHELDSLLVASVVEVESTFDPKAGPGKGQPARLRYREGLHGAPFRSGGPPGERESGAGFRRKILRLPGGVLLSPSLKLSTRVF